MTEQHRAKPEVWAAVEKFGKNEMDMLNCVLELRARVEELEADRRTILGTGARLRVGLNANEPVKPSHLAEPDSSLVEQVRCKSCMWFAPKQSGEFLHLGRCRRHAPTMNGYPVVFVNDWCGDHKLNEAWFASYPS